MPLGRSKPLPRAYTAYILALISKVDSPSTFAYFRPISLCNFCYKILSRIISDRLSQLLPDWISNEQGAFVKGSEGVENVSLAQELSEDIGRWGHNVIFKLDMAKALDKNSISFTNKYNNDLAIAVSTQSN